MTVPSLIQFQYSTGDVFGNDKKVKTAQTLEFLSTVKTWLYNNLCFRRQKRSMDVTRHNASLHRASVRFLLLFHLFLSNDLILMRMLSAENGQTRCHFFRWMSVQAKFHHIKWLRKNINECLMNGIRGDFLILYNTIIVHRLASCNTKYELKRKLSLWEYSHFPTKLLYPPNFLVLGLKMLALSSNHVLCYNFKIVSFIAFSQYCIS